MHNPFSLKDKTILVTGASSGIGRATAILCSQMGANVVVTGRNAKRLEETFLLLDDHSRGHLQIIADLTTDEGLNNLISQIPKLDGVVCNAGINDILPIQFYTKEKINNLFDINLFAPMMLTKMLVKKKILNKNSSIVYTSSAGGVWVASVGNSIYGATKSALGAFLKGAALEFAPKGIRCNSVNPGMVETPLIKGGAFSDEELKEDAKRYPLGRYGKPEDIANAIVFLLSDASSWITGTELKIDGGRTL